MFPKGIIGIDCSLLQISRKIQLFPQRVPAFDRVRLTPFAFPDIVRNAKHVVDTLCTDKNATIVIGEDDVARFDQKITKPRGA